MPIRSGREDVACGSPERTRAGATDCGLEHVSTGGSGGGGRSSVVTRVVSPVHLECFAGGGVGNEGLREKMSKTGRGRISSKRARARSPPTCLSAMAAKALSCPITVHSLAPLATNSGTTSHDSLRCFEAAVVRHVQNTIRAPPLVTIHTIGPKAGRRWRRRWWCGHSATSHLLGLTQRHRVNFHLRRGLRCVARMLTRSNLNRRLLVIVRCMKFMTTTIPYLSSMAPS